MYQTKDNFKGFPMAVMLAQSYSHSSLSRTQEGWLSHMDFPNPPLHTPVHIPCLSSLNLAELHLVATNPLQDIFYFPEY